MLVLTRKLNEQIVIGDSVTLSVVQVGGNKVRLGISAPPEVDIVRGELLERSNQSPQILIVDESSDDRKQLQRFLVQPNQFTPTYTLFTFSEAESCQQALAICREQRPECVLVNSRLTDSSGLALVHKLRQADLTSTIPVILLTGSPNRQIATEATQLGVREVLAKSQLSPELLQQTVQKALRALQQN